MMPKYNDQPLQYSESGMEELFPDDFNSANVFENRPYDQPDTIVQSGIQSAKAQKQQEVEQAPYGLKQQAATNDGFLSSLQTTIFNTEGSKITPDLSTDTGRWESASKSLATFGLTYLAMKIAGTQGDYEDEDEFERRSLGIALGTAAKSFGTDANRSFRLGQRDELNDRYEPFSTDSYILSGNRDDLVEYEKAKDKKFKPNQVSERFFSTESASAGTDIAWDKAGLYTRSTDPNTGKVGQWVLKDPSDEDKAEGKDAVGSPFKRTKMTPKTDEDGNIVYEADGKTAVQVPSRDRQGRIIQENVVAYEDSNEPSGFGTRVVGDVYQEKITAEQENSANKFATEARERTRQLAKINGLLQRVEGGTGPDGVVGTLVETIKKWVGSQTLEATEFRQGVERLINSEVISNLPPGPATDRDIDIVRRGYPPSNADVPYIEQWLKAIKRIAKAEREYNNFAADFVIKNRGSLIRFNPDGTTETVDQAFQEAIKGTEIGKYYEASNEENRLEEIVVPEGATGLGEGYYFKDGVYYNRDGVSVDADRIKLDIEF